MDTKRRAPVLWLRVPVFNLVRYLYRILGYTPRVAGLAYLPLTAAVFAISHSCRDRSNASVRAACSP